MNIILHHLEQDKQVSLARFNDGELGALMGMLDVTSRGKQDVTDDLRLKLQDALYYESENYYKAYPCSECYRQYYNDFNRYVGDYKYQLPLSHFTNNTGKWVKREFLKVLHFKETCYIGGNDCNRQWLGRHFSSHSLWPESNTASYANLIIQYVQASDKKIFVFAIGAVSRWLVMETHKLGKSGLDLGSMFNPETTGVELKCHKWPYKYQNKQKFCKICNY